MDDAEDALFRANEEEEEHFHEVSELGESSGGQWSRFASASQPLEQLSWILPASSVHLETRILGRALQRSSVKA